MKSRSIRIKIFRNATLLAGKSDIRHEIRWTDYRGQRRLLKRSKFSAALREANRIADDLARGHVASERMNCA